MLFLNLGKLVPHILNLGKLVLQLLNLMEIVLCFFLPCLLKLFCCNLKMHLFQQIYFLFKQVLLLCLNKISTQLSKINTLCFLFISCNFFIHATISFTPLFRKQNVNCKFMTHVSASRNMLVICFRV